MRDKFNNGIDINIEEMIKKYGSAFEVKKSMMKEYVFKLNEIIQNGAIYGDGNIEAIKAKWQNYFDIVEEFIDEERRENAIDNMELLDEDEEYTSYTLAEITQDILDNNGVGSFSKF
ncbi:MAG: hypothetical protein ACI9TV_002704 [Sulfurimonas sp.]|uniref:hypothetical protein n=1 Tax=Sulfurimonas sp. TaxID=2022749 RepID=UPI0039E63BB7